MWRSLIAAWVVAIAAGTAPLLMLARRQPGPKWRFYANLFRRFEEHDGKKQAEQPGRPG
jgi:hypothetical protein